MLKDIPEIISPELMFALMQMGHGDEIVIGDGNFPATACARRLTRCDGHGVPALLDGILRFFPLDEYVDCPVSLMAVAPGGHAPAPSIWGEYKNIIHAHGHDAKRIEYLERFTFYERAKEAFAIVATGESAIYANIILKKGVVQKTK